MTLPPPTSEDLQIAKLQLEVAALRRPFYKTPTFWIGAITTSVAVIGVFAQSYMSKLERQQAQIDRDIAVLTRMRVENEVKDLTREREAVDSQVKSLTAELKEVRDSRRLIDDKLTSLLVVSAGSPRSRELDRARAEAERALIVIQVVAPSTTAKERVIAAITELGYKRIDYQVRSTIQEAVDNSFSDASIHVIEFCPSLSPGRAVEIGKAIESASPPKTWKPQQIPDSLCTSGSQWKVRILLR